uniref:Uncharacterized protein n=1 Tax=Ditylenchus dipsaci TaxID=166011 RepID=A0A915DVU7_9BILA
MPIYVPSYPIFFSNPTTSVFHIQLPTKTSPTFNNSSVPVSADYYTGKRRKHHHKHHNAYPFSKIPVNAFMNDSIHSMNNSNTPANVPLDVNRIENNGSLLNKTTGESINPLQNQPFNGGSGTPPMISIKKRDVIQVPLSRDHYEKFLQINPFQGWELVNSINISRAAVSKRRLSLPSSKWMNMLNWSDDLAKEALQKLKSKSRHHYIEVIDLQFIEMLPDYANTELKFKDMAIELDLQNLLMWLVKQYFKKFANGGLRCSKNNCRANCRKRHGTECYAFELIHDQAENIGCAVKFHKEGGPILQADLTCVL